MESLSSSVSTSIAPPPPPLRHRNHHRRRRALTTIPSSSAAPLKLRPISSFPAPFVKPGVTKTATVSCKFSSEGDGGGNGEEVEEEEVERALRLDGTIPGSSNEFVEQVSSRAYDMRRHLQQTVDSSSYDVLETNPWREDSKPVYVLTRRENQLCTMKTRRNRSEVERELGLLFSKGQKLRNQAKQSATKFQMVVEDITDGVLVFEDGDEAAKYCDLLQGGGQGCEGVAEIDASSVFDLCRKMKALAVLFRRGTTPPQPESLKLNLRARKRSLEDQEDTI